MLKGRHKRFQVVLTWTILKTDANIFDLFKVGYEKFRTGEFPILQPPYPVTYDCVYVCYCSSCVILYIFVIQG